MRIDRAVVFTSTTRLNNWLHVCVTQNIINGIVIVNNILVVVAIAIVITMLKSDFRHDHERIIIIATSAIT
ncbi:hypothetical protein ACHAXM_009284, partial [Skeletonema potamos]